MWRCWENIVRGQKASLILWIRLIVHCHIPQSKRNLPSTLYTRKSLIITLLGINDDLSLAVWKPSCYLKTSQLPCATILHNERRASLRLLSSTSLQMKPICLTIINYEAFCLSTILLSHGYQMSNSWLVCLSIYSFSQDSVSISSSVVYINLGNPFLSIPASFLMLLEYLVGLIIFVGSCSEPAGCSSVSLFNAPLYVFWPAVRREILTWWNKLSRIEWFLLHSFKLKKLNPYTYGLS